MAGMDKHHSRYWDCAPADNSSKDADGSTVVGPPNAPATTSSTADKDVELNNVNNISIHMVNLLVENFVCHPFIVLRRQCQVHNHSLKYHIIPITLIPVMCQLHKHQGISTLWKGMGSTLLVRGLYLGLEDLLSKITPWPKKLSHHGSVKAFFQHTLLKGVTLAIIMPFHAASLVETVQSDIASEKPGILDVFREGVVRLLHWTGNVKGRMLPIWALILPTVTLGIVHYFFSLVMKSGVYQIIQVQYKHRPAAKGTLSKHVSNIKLLQDIELYASLVAAIASEVVFYPFETIMHRLYLQGTRTIIDDLDTGRFVIPILTNYHDPLECYESCLSNEGTFGFYKGFGALIMQYTVHILLIQTARYVLTKVTAIMYNTQKHTNNCSLPGVIQHSPIPKKAYLLP